MLKYNIEWEIPGAGSMSKGEFKAMAESSCSDLRKMGPQIQWVQSYFAGDKFYCIYIAPDEGSIREHAGIGGFPANLITEVSNITDPTTAEI